MVIIGAIILVAATVFVLENREPVTITFVGWTYSAPLGVALLVALLVGAVVIYIGSLIRQAQLRAQIRSTEARLRDLERQQRQAEGDEQAARV